jgi:hypothetical protein
MVNCERRIANFGRLAAAGSPGWGVPRVPRVAAAYCVWVIPALPGPHRQIGGPVCRWHPMRGLALALLQIPEAVASKRDLS